MGFSLGRQPGLVPVDTLKHSPLLQIIIRLRSTPCAPTALHLRLCLTGTRSNPSQCVTNTARADQHNWCSEPAQKKHPTKHRKNIQQNKDQCQSIGRVTMVSQEIGGGQSQVGWDRDHDLKKHRRCSMSETPYSVKPAMHNKRNTG